jgi:uncharacterized protein (TIGR00369 family)
MNERFSRVPANRHFGFQLLSQSPDEVVVSMKVSANHRQESGVVHGGLVSAVADTAAVYVFYPYLADDQTMASIEFKMNFLRPANVDQDRLIARAKVLQRGRKIGVCEVEVAQADAVVAKGLFTYLFVNKSEWKPGARDLTSRSD